MGSKKRNPPYDADPRKQAAEHPFQHTVLVRPTEFRTLRTEETDARLEFHQALGGFA